MSFPWLWRPVCAVSFMTALSAGMALALSARVGSLQCHLSGGVGMILMENQALDCVYQDESGAPPSHYIGRLTNVGANIGISGPGELVSAVVAVTGNIGPGALAGDYVGAQGSVPSEEARAGRCSSAATITPYPFSHSRCKWEPGSTCRRALAISTCNICL
jgi:Protein of unknown function (DUF992)